MVQRQVEVGFRPQPGPQVAFLKAPFDIVVYGGARGGGKSYATLGEFWLHAEAHGQHARGLMVRKTREDLKDTIDTATIMYGSAAVWNEQKKFFRFHNGAVLHMAYLESDADAQNYQGWSLTRVYVEELTQYADSRPIFKLLATLRSAVPGIKCQFRATCNPGGPGHLWVKQWVIDLGPMKPYKDPVTGLTRIFIAAKVTDNPALLKNDPRYIDRLKASGSPELVRAWLDGDWDVVEGAFFPEFDKQRHVIAPFRIPPQWIKFRSMDWGSARPFSVGWWAVVQDDTPHDGRIMPRDAIVRYREWYGAKAPNEGLKIPAELVAKGIRERESNEDIAYGVLDPAAFAVISGPSIGETFIRKGVYFRRADNARLSVPKRFGGWDQVRFRLRGNEDGHPMIFIFNDCHALLRTLPMMQHSEINPEDLDTEAEDHAVDECRYACMSRPFRAHTISSPDDKNPLLVRNAFKLDELGRGA
jgi:Terminase large subunit, T4likevirus-type, N-terminal